MPHLSEQGAVGLLVGTFDLFHVGHLDATLHAVHGVGRVVVGVASDDLAERVTGRRPFVPETERREIVGALRGVSAAVLLRDPDPRAAAAELGATVLLPLAGDEVAARLVGELRAAGDDTLEVAPLPPVRGTASGTLRAALGEFDEFDEYDEYGTDGRASVA